MSGPLFVHSTTFSIGTLFPGNKAPFFILNTVSIPNQCDLTVDLLVPHSQSALRRRKTPCLVPPPVSLVTHTRTQLRQHRRSDEARPQTPLLSDLRDLRPHDLRAPPSTHKHAACPIPHAHTRASHRVTRVTHRDHHNPNSHCPRCFPSRPVDPIPPEYTPAPRTPRGV